MQYSGTPLLLTPWGLGNVSCIDRCPHFRSKFILRTIWETAKCPYYRCPFFTYTRGSTVFSATLCDDSTVFCIAIMLFTIQTFDTLAPSVLTWSRFEYKTISPLSCVTDADSGRVTH